MSANAKILICDDAAFIRMMLKHILKQNGYSNVEEAANGAEAVKKYESIKPDLVLMDITMPEMDGLEALKRIREKDPEAAVVICSELSQAAIREEAFQNGAKDFVTKPFPEKAIADVLKKYLDT